MRLKPLQTLLIIATALLSLTASTSQAHANPALTQARQQQGNELAQHLGQGWRFDGQVCQLHHEQASNLIRMTIPISTVQPQFNSSGASLACPANTTCITRRIDNRANTPLASVMLVSGASWRSTHAANLATRLHALCSLPNTATSTHIQSAIASNNSAVSAFIMNRRENLFGSVRPRLNELMGFVTSSCTIEEPRPAGGRAFIPVREVSFRPWTPGPNKRGIEAQCSRPGQSCVRLQGGHVPAVRGAKWTLSGTQAQQNAALPTLLELQSICVFDHQLPPTIN
jgi:hypothetical protein